MCDTFVIMPDHSGSGNLIFGKNSDREANEAQSFEYHHAQDYMAGSELKCTHTTVRQVSHTYAILISRPFWMWGAEMGINEKGVVIGNEAVFTKVRVNNSSGLTGMDILRLALERAASAQAAVDIIIQLLSDFGQGGNCGYTKSLYYHNSFLIADGEEAWLMETAGNFWIIKKINDYISISNCLSIGEDFDRIHAEAISYARSKGWSKKSKNFHFAKSFSNNIYSYLSGSSERRKLLSHHLGTNGNIYLKDAMDFLRTHQIVNFSPSRSILMQDICSHAANTVTRHAAQTCNSMVVELSEKKPPSVWSTMTSAPCTSVFKPVGFSTDTVQEIFQSPGQQYNKESLWWYHELLHRTVLNDYPSLIQSVRKEFDGMESSFIRQFQKLKSQADVEKLMVESIRKHRQAIAQFVTGITREANHHSSGILFRNYWKKLNQQAGIPI